MGHYLPVALRSKNNEYAMTLTCKVHSSKFRRQGRFGCRLSSEFMNFQTNDDAKCTRLSSFGNNCMAVSLIEIQNSIKLFYKFHTYATESFYRYPSSYLYKRVF